MTKKEESEKKTKTQNEEDFEIEYITNDEAKEKIKKIEIKSEKEKRKDSKIEHLKKENEKLKEEYLRQMADKENLRKRLEREKNEYYQYALSEVLNEFLTVLDNFERALKSDDKSDKENFREGIELIHKQFLDILQKQGVEPVEIVNKKFDPHLHQAFITEESKKVKEPEVSEELQKGYKHNDRLLRPSLVKVILPKKED
jgi:molecular chaperone GrpE